MAKISLAAAEQFQNTNNTKTTNQVTFFSLRDNGDEAIVRFMYDNVDEFEILTYHSVSVITDDGSSRDIKVGCIRNLNEPPEKCPLCASGNKLNQRIFIRMLQYVPDEMGGIQVKPVVWERSTQYALKLREYLNNYGPLSDIICKIIRHGAKGDLKTTYEIVPNLNKNIYPDEVYVKDTSIINSYQASGTIVADKTSEEITTYLTNGQFPKPQKQEQNNLVEFSQTQTNYQSNDYASPQLGITYNQVPTPVQQQVQIQIPQQTVTQTAPPTQQMPWQQNQSGIQRPIRTY